MSDNNIVVSSQRNLNDVAIELTKYYLKTFNSEDLTEEQVAEMYKFFYKTAAEAMRSR